MTTPSVDKQILVQSSGISLGVALKTHVTEKLTGLAGKYFGRITECHAHFKREGHSSYCCTLTLKSGGLPPRIAQASDHDIYTAFNVAARKLDSVLKEAKRAHRDHSGSGRPDKPIQNDGEHRVMGRRQSDRYPEHDLTTWGGADAYALALVQKARQDDEAVGAKFAEALPLAAE